MSGSSATGGQTGAEPNTRMWAEPEPEPGPSKCEPSRQGYCGYCRVLYSNLDQHLSSLQHLESVRSSSRGTTAGASSGVSSAGGRTKLTLLERFLQDVVQHHPHRYSDPRPSYDDLPAVSTPPSPRAAAAADEPRSREHPPSSDEASNEREGLSTCSQPGAKLSCPVKGGEEPQLQATPLQTHAPPLVHRKAHRKTNKRKTSKSSSSSHPALGPGRRTRRDPGPSLSPGPGCGPSGVTSPWLLWQKERREEVFAWTHSDLLDRTIEEVIQRCCHGDVNCPKEETDSFHFSLPVSMETQSEDWDPPVQVSLQDPHADPPVQVSQTEGRDLGPLMDSRVDLENRAYADQLDSALRGERRPVVGAGGFWTLPIEEVLPVPEHIPASFRGKTWAQIEEEDERRVEKLVRQFRRGRFLCYFDSESLARYGRRSLTKKGTQEADLGSGVLPLIDRDGDGDGDDSAPVRTRRSRRWSFRLASRCQVVKVSHSTQTVQLVIPAVPAATAEAPPTAVLPANRDTVERTPEPNTWRRLPPSYSTIISPVQPRTSLVYLLCSPAGPAPAHTPASVPPPKRCRKKRRPLDQQGLKVKYRRLPVRFYEPGSNRILKTAPKSILWCRGPAPSGAPPPHVRQLFRSLSPDLNTDRPPGEGAAGGKNQRTADPPLRDATDIRGRGRTAEAPPTDGSQQTGVQASARRTRLSASKRRTVAQTTPPPPPRREGLRRTCSASLAPPRGRRRGRGRGSERGRSNSGLHEVIDE